MKRLSPFVPALALLGTALLSGCARVATTTAVAADGSLTRTLVFRETAGAGEGDKKNRPSPMSGPKLEQLIVLPTGADWHIARTKDKDGMTITATRNVPAGATLTGDIGIRDAPPEPTGGTSGAGDMHDGQQTRKPKAPPGPQPAPKLPLGPLLVTNEVSVRQVVGGRLEYREVLHWQGPRRKALFEPDAEGVATMRRALPASLSGNTALVNALMLDIQREGWHIVYGPGEALLTTLIFNPDLAEYRIKRRIGSAILRTLSARAGDRLTEAERKSIATQLVGQMTKSTKSSGPTAQIPGMGSSSDSKDSNSSSPVSLFCLVKMPGKVVETNGELDTDTNEVVWSMYSEAVATDDIVLTATCEPAR